MQEKTPGKGYVLSQKHLPWHIGDKTRILMSEQWGVDGDDVGYGHSKDVQQVDQDK